MAWFLYLNAPVSTLCRGKYKRLKPSLHILMPLIFGSSLSCCGPVTVFEGGPLISDSVWTMRSNDPTVPGKSDYGYTPKPCPSTEDASNATTSSTPTAINNCIFAMINLVDTKYENFERSLFAAVSNTNFVVDTAVSGVGIAGGFLTGGASQVTSAIAGGLTGFNKSIDSDFLYSKTITVLIQQMRKDRATQLTIILNRMDATNATNAASKTQADLAAAQQTAASNAAQAAASMMQTVVQSAAPTTPGAKPTGSDAVAAVTNASSGVAAAATTAGTTQSAKPYRSIFEAMTDLHQYALAGSWSHALISLQSDTSTGATNAAATANAAKTGTTASK